MFARILGFILLIIVLTNCATTKQELKEPKQKKISLPALQFSDTLNHTFVLGNKIAGFFVGQSREQNSSSYQGWTVNEQHIFRDYKILIAGQELVRHQSNQFRYFPYGFERHYPDGLVEKFLFMDSLDALIVRVEGVDECAIMIETGNQDFKLTQDIAKIHQEWEYGALDVQLRKPIPGVTEFWFGLNGSLQSAVMHKQTFEKLVYNAWLNLQPALANYADTRLNDAAHWSAFALDNLITKQRGAGIWAGLPWFNNYWGRDTFISFNGALLVSGKFDRAKDILRNFAGFQLQDSTHLHYGRIPNRITNNEVIYNTADGTWWFIRELYEYYLYTADLELINELFPVVQTAIEGALEKRGDAHSFLTHADAETWMDAKGAEGAWSPRGNRAVEIQALWYTALNVAAELAELSEQNPEITQRWSQAAIQLKKSFNTCFWDESNGSLYDHLNPDDSQDRQMRPNQIFAITVPDLPGIAPLLNIERQRSVAQQVMQNLTRAEGVMSLSPEDENFHPFHHYQPYYVPDAAYHNGLIWTWLAGPVVSALAKFDQTAPMMAILQNEANQIINWDAVGNYSELLEPVLRTGTDHLKISGTVSQAWNLAEFQRNLVQDLIGYQPVAGKNAIILTPQIPQGFGSITARLPFKQNFLKVKFSEKEDQVDIQLESPLKETIKGIIQLRESGKKIPFSIAPNKPIFKAKLEKLARKEPQDIWPFAENPTGNEFKVLQHPGYDLLKPEQVVYDLPADAQSILSAADMLFDDKGKNKNYTYPQNSVFKHGIADIASFKLEDGDNAWAFVINMRNLTDPGWHLEYGFQLTFLTLAIEPGDSTEEAAQNIRRSSNYVLSGNRSFKRLIFVGGGVEIQNAMGERMAQFIPQKTEHALGFVGQRQIRFKIPKKYLPGLSDQSKITILSGLQDDHGGAGIGAFRAVRAESGEWHGGGAENNTDGSTVYDILEIN